MSVLDLESNELCFCLNNSGISGLGFKSFSDKILIDMENEFEQPIINFKPADLKRYFINHLNKIYCAKNHLVENFPAVLELATFADLKETIKNSIEDLRNQIARMREIYSILKISYEPGSCRMFQGLIDELFIGARQDVDNPELRDMSIIYYLQNLESLEMASFHALQMAAIKFKNNDINELLAENFDDAKTERAMLRLLTAKYLTSN